MLFSIQKRLKWKRLQQRRHINKCQNESDELQETNEKVQDDIVSILCFEQIVKKKLLENEGKNKRSRKWRRYCKQYNKKANERTFGIMQ